MRNQAVSSARNQPCSPLHLFSFLTYAKYGWQNTDIAPPAWHLCATLLCAWKVRFSCLENLLHRAEFCVRSSTLEIDCELHTLISWAMERRPLPSLPYYLTVLVQDLCYSDPLSSVLTISDPIQVRDDLSLYHSFSSLCMLQHASMRSSCGQTDRTTIQRFLMLRLSHTLLKDVHSCFCIWGLLCMSPHQSEILQLRLARASRKNHRNP